MDATVLLASPSLGPIAGGVVAEPTPASSMEPFQLRLTWQFLPANLAWVGLAVEQPLVGDSLRSNPLAGLRNER